MPRADAAGRVDVAGIDLRRRLPVWALRLLGVPGHVSLRRAGREAASAEFAAIASAASRTIGVTPYPGQLLASAALAQGLAVEMDTGEGKTLAGAMAAA